MRFSILQNVDERLSAIMENLVGQGIIEKTNHFLNFFSYRKVSKTEEIVSRVVQKRELCMEAGHA